MTGLIILASIIIGVLSNLVADYLQPTLRTRKKAVISLFIALTAFIIGYNEFKGVNEERLEVAQDDASVAEDTTVIQPIEAPWATTPDTMTAIPEVAEKIPPPLTGGLSIAIYDYLKSVTGSDFLAIDDLTNEQIVKFRDEYEIYSDVEVVGLLDAGEVYGRDIMVCSNGLKFSDSYLLPWSDFLQTEFSKNVDKVEFSRNYQVRESFLPKWLTPVQFIDILRDFQKQHFWKTYLNNAGGHEPR